jgi:hypothetical protein
VLRGLEALSCLIICVTGGDEAWPRTRERVPDKLRRVALYLTGGWNNKGPVVRGFMYDDITQHGADENATYCRDHCSMGRAAARWNATPRGLSASWLTRPSTSAPQPCADMTFLRHADVKCARCPFLPVLPPLLTSPTNPHVRHVGRGTPEFCPLGRERRAW